MRGISITLKYTLEIVLTSSIIGYVTTSNQTVIAKALFYKDPVGRVILAAGDVPISAVDAIRNDIQARNQKNMSVLVVPVFPNITNIPSDVNIINYLKKMHPTVYVTELPKRMSRNILTEMWYHIMYKNKAPILDPAYDIIYNEYVWKTTVTEKKQKSSPRITTAKLLSEHEDFVPNDIFYSIEKTCANWADGCDQRTVSIANMSSKLFQIPLLHKRPQKLHWDR